MSVCESSLKGKMIKRTFKTKGNCTTVHLEFVQTDVCKPMGVQAKGRYDFFITFSDDYSRYGFAYLMCHKSELLKNS